MTPGSAWVIIVLFEVVLPLSVSVAPPSVPVSETPDAASDAASVTSVINQCRKDQELP